MAAQAQELSKVGPELRLVGEAEASAQEGVVLYLNGGRRRLPSFIQTLIAVGSPNGAPIPRQQSELEDVLGGLSLAFTAQVDQLRVLCHRNPGNTIGVRKYGDGISIPTVSGMFTAGPEAEDTYLAMGTHIRLGNGKLVRNYQLEIPHGVKPTAIGTSKSAQERADREARQWADRARMHVYGDGVKVERNLVMQEERILTGPIQQGSHGEDKNVVAYYGHLQNFARILLTVGYRLQR